MSKVYIVQGEHWSVPGAPITAHATKDSADAAAKKLVDVMIADLGGHNALDIDPVDASWEEALRMLQMHRARELAGDESWEALEKGEAPYGYGSYEDALTEIAECDVWITELELENSLEELYETLAKTGRIWLELLVQRQEIDPEATAITFHAKMNDGSSREVAKTTLADAFKKFDDAGIDVSKEMEGLI